jgi:hypothetical protein
MDLKLELFNFQKGLDYESQAEIANVVRAHFENAETSSEMRLIKSLNEQLEVYKYDKEVVAFLEKVNEGLATNELVFGLKDLYKVIESRNLGMVYRQPLNVLLGIINLENDEDRMGKILNELAVYNWVPEIKLFIHNLTKSPEQQANLLQGGNSEPVYTIVESVENGHVVFLKDSWFLLKDDEITKTTLESNVTDDEKLRMLRTLETAMKYSTITDDRINFKINENLVIGLGTSGGKVFINDDEVNKETTLESLFSSPIIPIVNKQFYPLIETVSANVGKFVELDVVRKVTNLVNPFCEKFAFNYKNNMFVYNFDTRYGSSLYKYESAVELIDEIKNDLNYDLTYFFEDKLSDEMKAKRYLEDKEREIRISIEELDKNVDKVEANMKMIGESEQLSKALEILNTKRKELDAELLAVKEMQQSPDKEQK